MHLLYQKIYKKVFGDPDKNLTAHIPPPDDLSHLKIGDVAPNFDLEGTDGRRYTLDNFREKKILSVVFSCNHCPYVKAYEDRLIEIQEAYREKSFQLIAINSNDSDRFPEETLGNMIVRARAKNFNFPYLRDEDQNVAKVYGPERTPEVFVFDEDRRLRYHGRIDDNVTNPEEVANHDLKNAVESILSGTTVRVTETVPVGCVIKWKLQGRA